MELLGVQPRQRAVRSLAGDLVQASVLDPVHFALPPLVHHRRSHDATIRLSSMRK